MYSIFIYLFVLVQLAHGSLLPFNFYKRIYGGQAVKQGAITYEVKLTMPGYVLCGGTLVSDKYVVTAAHCLMKTNLTTYPDDSVTIGYGNVDVKKQKTVKSAKLTINTGFAVDNAHDNFTKDIAVIELAEPIKFDDTVSAIPIYSGTLNPGQVLSVAGWGGTPPPPGKKGGLPQVLQQADVKVGDIKKECGQFKWFKGNDGPHLCIPTDLTPGISTCGGDSGSGYIMNVDGKSPALVAVNSIRVGGDCGAADTFHFPVSAKYYIDFLTKATGLSQDELYGKTTKDNNNSPGSTTTTKPDKDYPSNNPSPNNSKNPIKVIVVVLNVAMSKTKRFFGAT